MDKLGVAFLGLDHWYAAEHIAPAVARGEHTRLVAVAHDDMARARALLRGCDADKWTTDYRAALDRPDVQIVVALYSTDRNVAICREAAALGKHIVSVKPMALDLAGADAIVAAVREAGVHFFPFECGWRLRAADKRTKQWLAEGRIGQPLRFLHALYSSLPIAWSGSQDTRTWWLDPRRVPGGAWIDHAIYAVDLARWLFDSAPIQVRGVTGRQIHSDLEVEDFGIATFTFANGASAVIEDTWTAERGYGFMRNEIAGSAGAIIDRSGWGGGQIDVRGAFGFDGWLTISPPPESQPTVIDHMAMCVRGEAAPLVTVEDGRTNLAACLAFYAAARSGTTVQI